MAALAVTFRTGAKRRRAYRGTGADKSRAAAGNLRTQTHRSSTQTSEAYLAEGQRLSHTGSWGWNVVSGKLYGRSNTTASLAWTRKPPKPRILHRCNGSTRRTDPLFSKPWRRRSANEATSSWIVESCVPGEDSPRRIVTVPARGSICPSGDACVAIGRLEIDTSDQRMHACATATATASVRS
jgi:hypothetical protein